MARLSWLLQPHGEGGPEALGRITQAATPAAPARSRVREGQQPKSGGEDPQFLAGYRTLLRSPNPESYPDVRVRPLYPPAAKESPIEKFTT